MGKLSATGQPTRSTQSFILLGSINEWDTEETVGQALHWPCVTDNRGLITYGLNGLCQGDEQHSAYSCRSIAILYLFQAV